MEALITVLPGDGIGPEVATAGRQALEQIAAIYGHKFEFSEQLIGGAAIDATQDPCPPDTRLGNQNAPVGRTTRSRPATPGCHNSAFRAEFRQRRGRRETSLSRPPP